MSAWYIFSALGFYPFDPCGGKYVLGAPQVPEATVRLADGKTLTVAAEGLTGLGSHVGAVSLRGERIKEHANIISVSPCPFG